MLTVRSDRASVPIGARWRSPEAGSKAEGVVEAALREAVEEVGLDPNGRPWSAGYGHAHRRLEP